MRNFLLTHFMYTYIFLFFSVFLLASCTTPGTTPVLPASSGSSTPIVMIPSPTYGSGKHAMTIFADFQCPACIRFSQSIAPLFEDYAKSGYLTITYKQYPLTNIHRNAERDALAALCGAEQGKYTEYKKALYALEESKSGAKVTDDDRVSAAKDTGIDSEKLAACIADDRYLWQVRAEIQEWNALRVTGTPSIFLDGKKLDLALFPDTATLKMVMDRLLEVPAMMSGTGIVK